MTKLERHPLGAANRPLTDDEKQELRDSIDNKGVIRPILIFDGMVLDGWNRYEICQETGLECPQEQFEGTFEDAVDRVLAEQTHRNLTLVERIELRQRIAGVPKRGGQAKCAPGAHSSKGTAEAIAADLGTSRRTVQRVRAVQKTGTPELNAAMRTEKVSIKEAEGIAKLPPQDQAAALEAPKPAPARPRNAPRGHIQSDIPAPQIGASLEALDELKERNSVLIDECERLEVRAAVNFMEGTEEERAAARILIEELQARVKSLEAELDAVKASRDSHMVEVNELKKQCATYRRQLTQQRQDA